jgi:hypothetical protein
MPGPVLALKDYWFDWRNYHDDSTLYKHKWKDSGAVLLSTYLFP